MCLQYISIASPRLVRTKVGYYVATWSLTTLILRGAFTNAPLYINDYFFGHYVWQLAMGLGLGLGLGCPPHLASLPASLGSHVLYPTPQR